MPFQVSPGVNVSEIDLTTVVPAVTSTVGAIAGVFNWGPVEDRVLIATETELVNTFGRPTADNFETFYTAANFLAYGNQLYVSRAAATTNYNASANGATSTNGTYQIKNIDDFNAHEDTYTGDTDYNFFAKYPGTIGNSLKISICASVNAYSQILSVNSTSTGVVSASVGESTANLHFSSTGAATTVWNQLTVGDYLLIGNTDTGTQYIKITSKGSVPATNAFSVSLDDVIKVKDDIDQAANTVTRYWEYFNVVDSAPGTSNFMTTRIPGTTVKDELHIIIADEDGVITGVPGQILEAWRNVSRATDALGEQGGSNYYVEVLKNNSLWVWPGYDLVGTATSTNLVDTSQDKVYTASFGTSSTDDTETSIAISKVLTAYDKFASAEEVDISLVLAGHTRGGTYGEQIANYIIDNICEVRKDCVAFISPQSGDVVNVPGQEIRNLTNFRNALRSTSYAVLDSGYKYQYDKYNDKYRWVPLNGDIAGLCVRTDNVRDPWFSPAGFNRGAIKNVVKLAYNPDKAGRDQLYKNGINPVVNFPGQGVILYGDKTLLARPSAFDRINVRRLFIVLEKAIAKAAQSSLFEFNDDFTRAAFRNLVEPYLRDIQGRRGIYDFRVVCDTTNNTPEVIDRNEFRGDIYVKPARSINFIQLNFVAVRTGVEFDEIVGKF